MDADYSFLLEIKGALPESWAGWFAGLDIKHLPGGRSQLRGTLADQSALMGILLQVNNLGMEIIMLECHPLR